MLELVSKVYEWRRCLQFAEQLFLVKKCLENFYATADRSSISVLELGPGDHALARILVGDGIKYESINIDEDDKLSIYRGDVRDPDLINRIPDKNYDIIIAFEVLEHMPIKHFDMVIQSLSKKLRGNGFFLISLPASMATIWLRPAHGLDRPVRLPLPIPRQFVRDLLFPLVVAHKLLVLREPWSRAVRINPFAGMDDKSIDHHWDLGYRPTLFRSFSRRLEKHGAVIYRRLNAAALTALFAVRVSESRPT